VTFTDTRWMALRRPDAGWHSPLAVVARDASVAVPRLTGIQDSVNCEAKRFRGLRLTTISNFTVCWTGKSPPYRL
jgi:hypothetical protein